MLPPDLLERVQAWVAADPDRETRAELERLMADDAVEQLQDRFAGMLAFGTAGLRGPMGAGPTRMNRLVVRRAAAGLMAYLGDGASVVIGHDARHHSAGFAAEVAAVVAGHGGDAHVFPHPVPTPLLAFAVRHLGVDAGVMVTASHNPAGDNGLKVYLADGIQIGPPAEGEVAAAIAAAPADGGPVADREDLRRHELADTLVDAYVQRAAALVPPGPRAVRIVYTPLHGVGLGVTEAVFAAAGFTDVHVVAAQAQPDPDFPTVAYPNPEEPGALDGALTLAAELGADVVLAHDPDADRLGVAVPHDGAWVTLTGNEIGALLCDHVLRHGRGSDRLVVDTLVSAGLVEAIARDQGVQHLRTLTGFKWVMRAVAEHPSLRFAFAYEEALGFAVTDLARDKDGITAALVFAALVADLKAGGGAPLTRLAELAQRHGLFATDTWSVRVDGPGAAARLVEMMRHVRTQPPRVLGDWTVEEVDDLLGGGPYPATDALVLHLSDGARVALRPSGTEPKIKAYGQVVQGLAAGDPMAAYRTAKAQADQALARLRVAALGLLETKP